MPDPIKEGPQPESQRPSKSQVNTSQNPGELQENENTRSEAANPLDPTIDTPVPSL